MRYFLIILAVASPSQAADYTLPAENQGWWTPHTAEGVPGVGVPGGFLRFTAGQSEDRAVTGNVIDVTQSPYNADNTGTSDTRSAIESAINAASSGDVVYLPAGSYRLDGTLTIGVSRDNITLRGAGPDQTIILANGADDQSLATIGIGLNSWGGNPKQTITGTKTKGTTTLTVTDSSLFSTNVPAVIYVENENDDTRIAAGAPITWSSGLYGERRTWPVMVTGKPTGTTITIDPPLLIDCTDYTTKISPGDAPTSDLRYFGIEDMRFEDSGAYTFLRGLQFYRGIYCWVYNVEFLYQDTGAAGNCLFWYSGFRNEVFQCRFTCDPTDGEASFSDGAIQHQDQTGMLIANNIFDSARATSSWGWDVAIYSDGNFNNGVIAYNFFEQSHKNVLINHTQGHALLGLIEGNIGQRVQHDGYYSSTSHYTLYRNWWSGRNASGEAHPSGGYTSWFKRFSRNFALVGNVWGWDGAQAAATQYGYPNIGNDDYTGTAQPTLGDWWADWAAYKAATYSGGTNGFQELDLDVEPSFTIVHNYESASPGTGAVADSTVDTLPSSMYLTAKPDWFGTLTYPAINPDSPDFDIEAIPAGYRFVNGEDPPSIAQVRRSPSRAARTSALPFLP